jgi:Tol biopolymer transport system component
MLFFLLAVFALGALATVGLAAGGTGPADALTPTGAAQSIGGNQQQWFRFDYSGDKSLITAWLDSARASDLSFSIYTPDEIGAWINGDPLMAIGRGASGSGHDLFWTGRFNFHGTFYLVVQNNSSDTISFRVNVTGDAVTTTRNIVATPTPLPNPFATPVPVGSVSGGRIVFQQANGGNIYTVNPDGTGLTRVSSGIDPALSPDKARIAFARQGTPGGLFIANSDGSNEQLVYNANEVRSPMWSADGNRVVFTSINRVKKGATFCFRDRCISGEDQVHWQLLEYNLADNTTHDVFTPPEGGLSPTTNADNNTIAFVGPSLGLMLTSSDNSFAPYIIAGDLQFNSARFNPLNITAPVYSPDGKHLVFMVKQNPAWEIAVSDADGGNIRLLTRIDPLDFASPNNVAPTWSSDGSQVLFLSNRNGKWEFFAINFDGSNLRQVLKNVTDQVSLDYSYNGDRMVAWK